MLARGQNSLWTGANRMQTMHMRNSHLDTIVSKVPQVTFAFWIIKILATTLGETAATP